jgi:DNA-binding NarL/FixJ family response regulator
LVAVVATVEEVLDSMDRDEANVVVFDLSRDSQVEHGIEVLKVLRGYRPSVCIVVIRSAPTPRTVRRLRKAGASYLVGSTGMSVAAEIQLCLAPAGLRKLLETVDERKVKALELAAWDGKTGAIAKAAGVEPLTVWRIFTKLKRDYKVSTRPEAVAQLRVDFELIRGLRQAGGDSIHRWAGEGGRMSCDGTRLCLRRVPSASMHAMQSSCAEPRTGLLSHEQTERIVCPLVGSVKSVTSA